MWSVCVAGTSDTALALLLTKRLKTPESERCGGTFYLKQRNHSITPQVPEATGHKKSSPSGHLLLLGCCSKWTAEGSRDLVSRRPSCHPHPASTESGFQEHLHGVEMYQGPQRVPGTHTSSPGSLRILTLASFYIHLRDNHSSG